MRLPTSRSNSARVIVASSTGRRTCSSTSKWARSNPTRCTARRANAATSGDRRLALQLRDPPLHDAVLVDRHLRQAVAVARALLHCRVQHSLLVERMRADVLLEEAHDTLHRPELLLFRLLCQPRGHRVDVTEVLQHLGMMR